jgi:hypothetical protein
VRVTMLISTTPVLIRPLYRQFCLGSGHPFLRLEVFLCVEKVSVQTAHTKTKQKKTKTKKRDFVRPKKEKRWLFELMQ